MHNKEKEEFPIYTTNEEGYIVPAHQSGGDVVDEVIVTPRKVESEMSGAGEDQER